MDEHSLAYEMLEEIKKSNKRWFAIAIIELVIIVGMVVGFFIYESQFEYVTETTTTVEQNQETDDVNSSSMSQSVN